MQTTMQAGDRVEVQQVWAYADPSPLRHWFKGYEFVRYEGNYAIVRHTEGLYKGIEVRFPTIDVRIRKEV